MRRIVHYRESYKIVITDKFYEVFDGKTVLYYDQLKHRPTVQEVWNKTIGLYRSSFMTVNGDINDTNHFIKQVEKIAGKVAVQQNEKLINKMYDGLKYRSSR